MSAARGHRLRLAAAALLFSTGGAAIKACSLGPWQLASFRAVVAALALLALVPAARRRFSPRVALVALANAATVILFVRANKMTTAAATIFLQSLSPLYILALGPWLLGERARRRDLAYMVVLAVALPLFFVGPGTASATAPDPVRGNIVAACSGLTCGLMMIGLRWLGRDPRDAGAAPASVVLGNLLAAAIALPFALPVREVHARDGLILLYLGVVQIAIAYKLMMDALRHVPVLQASLLMFLEPVFSPVWAWLFHGEQPGPWALAGGALILGATAVYSRAPLSVPTATAAAAPASP